MSPKVEQSFLDIFFKNRFDWSHDFLMNLSGMLVDEFERRKSDCEKFLRSEVVDGIQDVQ